MANRRTGRFSGNGSSSDGESGNRGDASRLAALVRAAGGYVVPTDDLRPRTLEAARAQVENRRTRWRLGSLALAMATLLVCELQSGRDRRTTPQSISLEALHVEVQRRAALPGVGFPWALVEAISALRERQASLFVDRGQSAQGDEISSP